MVSNEKIILNLMILFFVYSILGWIMEVVLKFIKYGRFMNRGFLIGPYCPIYGVGVVLITIVNYLLAPVESSYGTTFLISFIFCGILEYVTSIYFERKYHARWRDYSNKPMNLNGRVWIGNLVAFGLGGTIVTRILNPFFFKYINRVSTNVLVIIVFIMFILFITDIIVSHFIMNILKVNVEQSNSDKSEEIAEEVRYLLENKSVLHRRLINAYPELIFRTNKIKERLERVKRESEQFIKENEGRLSEFNLNVKEKFFPENLKLLIDSQKDIIHIQDRLIKALINDEISENDMEKYIKEIDDKKKILNNKYE
ncbi:MAG: putative ABC transporter permease [Anaerococcus sp.]|nr:putative ABC transporter permease [Anaerococcus sp.]